MPETVTAQRGRGGRHVAVRTSEWSSPVLRGGLALTLNSIAGAALGLVFWVLAARLLPVAHVGLGMATVATITTVANLGQLNLYQTAGVLLAGSTRRRRLSLELTGLAAGATAVVGSGALLLWTVTDLGDELVVGGPLILACALGWTLFALKDGLLVGLRGFMAVPVLNTAYGLLKIAALVLTAAALGGASIVLATFLPILLVLPVAAWLLLGRTREGGAPLPAASSAGAPSGLDRRFIGVDYLGFVCLQLSTTLLPFLILSWAGAHAAGIFAVVWLLVVMLDTLAHNAGVPLASEAARDPRSARRLAGMIGRRAFALVALGVAGTLLLAEFILGFFGAEYAADGATALRLMVLASLARCYTVLTLALLRARRRAGAASGVEAVHLAALLCAAAVLVPAHGVTGMAAAWLVAQAATAAAAYFTRETGGSTR
ncbi:hypothetical protein ACQ3I4_12380 [Zafaria sp. Z1313]|uniref:hypothetical protein n=1 Tax=unclassified Zafaria TaxID=2828765 RepID=UPI002E7A4744|nr:hypothetical protein [Zafaria sp. J156]MEE1620481.1 hypothetical protein [Zafaria sp. J156]